MKRDLISIIVPVYNVEKYLDRCLNSIVNQTYTNLEIILVDDGSPDNCPAMCDEWAKKDSRIKVIHKKNAGLGMARNTGIDYATGEYICFFDSDDYVALDLVEKAHASIIKYHADIVIYGMNEVDISGKIASVRAPATEREFYSGDEVWNVILPGMIAGSSIKYGRLGLHISACAQMYSMKMIRQSGWRFVSEREYISEEYYSLLTLYGSVHSVAIICEPLYFYCYNEASLTHSFDQSRFEKTCICHEAMLKVCEQKQYPYEIVLCLHSQYIGLVIYTMKRISCSSADFTEKWRAIKKIVRDEYFQRILGEVDIKNETWKRRLFIALAKTKVTVLVFTLIKLRN